jgi:hypothetical protein
LSDLTLALARTSLPVRQRISAGVAAVLIRRLPVPRGCISPVLRVVLPPVPLASLSPVNVPVYVFVEIIVVVDVDVTAVPIAIAPVAAPSAPSGGT